MPKHREPLKKWLARYEQWKEGRALQRGRGRAAAAADEDLSWEARGQRALALQREHKLEVEQGKYLLREEVVEQWARRVFAVRTRLLALPRTLGSRCANTSPDLVEREADQIVRDILAEFVADGEATPNSQKRGGSDG